MAPGRRWTPTGERAASSDDGPSGSPVERAAGEASEGGSRDVSFYTAAAAGDYMNWDSIPKNEALGINAVPKGWEPIGLEVIGGTTSQACVLVHLRNCTSQ
jgi:hypothetical protein